MKMFTQDEAKKKVIGIFVRLEKKFAGKQVSGTGATPSSPDTRRFIATQSGFIRTTTNYCSFGYGGFAARRPFALQVGTLVSLEDQAAIKKSLIYAMKRAFGAHLKFTDGNRWDNPCFIVTCHSSEGEERVLVSQDIGTNYSSWYLE